MRTHRHRLNLALALLFPLAPASAQTVPDIQQILQRLDRLEGENRELREQVRELQRQIHPGATSALSTEESKPTLDERMDIEERRTAEQAQTKVEAAQRFPIRVTGTALVNAFYNSKQNGGVDDPTVASLSNGSAVGGATFRQTVLGLEYRGPETLWGGKISGSLFMDFFTGGSVSLGNTLRLRTASIGIDWQTRGLSFAQDKPLISARDPDSLAQVGVPPLTGAGNLWWWEPQLRFEQRVPLGDQAGLKAQIAVIETDEGLAYVPPAYSGTLGRSRPGVEGRAEFFRQFGGESRVEIAPGFHFSQTHVAGGSVPSHVFSTDWLIRPIHPAELTGFFFTGENVANLASGLRQGFSILGPGQVLPVRSRGGWTQLKLIATDRLSFHLMAGLQNDRAFDLLRGLGAQDPASAIGRNLAYGGNLFYKLAPNVILSFETLQTRTSYLFFGRRLNNHYDLALAYLF